MKIDKHDMRSFIIEVFPDSCPYLNILDDESVVIFNFEGSEYVMFDDMSVGLYRDGAISGGNVGIAECISDKLKRAYNEWNSIEVESFPPSISEHIEVSAKSEFRVVATCGVCNSNIDVTGTDELIRQLVCDFNTIHSQCLN